MVRTARCFFETFRQRWVTVTTTGNSFHRNYVPHGRGSSSKLGDISQIINCDVITCAAPNKASAQKYCHVSDMENHDVLESRIRFILNIAEHEQVDTLILGAFGSGVFGQDGTEVAEIFKKLLVEELWTFEKIIFAIPNDTRNGNYQKFMNVMSDAITRKE